jgi:nucleotide-binding universal stress UspA family protein
MNALSELQPGATVVVGIDGSQAALHAATWAIDEAIARDVPLRLVHAVSPGPALSLKPYELPLDIEYAETVLRQADAAIVSTGKDVKVDTAIVRSDPVPAFLAESDHAALVCLGTTGIGAVSRVFLGSTATALANQAHCPVAVIRYHGDGANSVGRRIAVAVKATVGEDVIVTAMEEARLRHASVLAVGLWQEDFGGTPYDELDRMMEPWRQRYPDVDVQPVATRSGLVAFLNDEHDPVGLVVVGADEASEVAKLVGPHRHHVMGHPECSVLVVRH